LYPEAEWLQNTVQQKHDVNVLTAYVIRSILYFLSQILLPTWKDSTM
jgi:hypothetical protein